jgi:two-component system, chemotaxis family, protein-glutamate methylesterase/glutaminase
MAVELVVVGSSWGGLEALSRLLVLLPPDFEPPIAIAQHRTPDPAGDGLAASIGAVSPLPVREVDDKDPLSPGTVYVAPADYHLMVERTHFELSVDAPVAYSRPSIDVLFESAADAFRDGVVGVLLTGANADGTAGLRRIRDFGGTTLVQDPSTAERPEMPEAAIRAGVADRVLPIEGLAAALTGRVHRFRSAAR